MSEYAPIRPVTDNEHLAFGIANVSYKLDGTPGANLLDAVFYASLKQSHSFEAAMTAMKAEIEKRSEQVEELAQAQAIINEVVASTDASEGDTYALSTVDPTKITKANELLERWGISKMDTADGGQVYYRTSYAKQSEVQTAVDTYNKDLQMEMSLMNNMLNKRDNAYEVANKVISKVNTTAQNTINMIGR